MLKLPFTKNAISIKIVEKNNYKQGKEEKYEVSILWRRKYKSN